MLLGLSMIMVLGVISSFFADIFKNNCLNIGVLPLKVRAILKELLAIIYHKPATEINVNLLTQTVKVEIENSKEFSTLKLVLIKKII